jgi:hypothetical protein
MDPYCKLNTKQEEYKDQLLHKWNNDRDIKCGKVPPSKGNKGGGKNREIINISDTYYVMDKCIICKKQIPIYFFLKQNNKRSKNPLEVVSGYESCDTKCILCSRKVAKDRGKEEKEIIRQMIKKDNGDLTNEWLKQQLIIQNNRCHITNLPITLERGYYNTASVQNNKDGKIHYQEHCVLIMQCIQVQEHGIKDLKEAWKQVLHMMKYESDTDTTDFLKELDTKYKNTPEQNGVTAPTQIHEDNVGICEFILTKLNGNNKPNKNAGKKCNRICVKNKSTCLLHLSKEDKKIIKNDPEFRKTVTNIKSKINPEYSAQCMKLHLPRILDDLVNRYYASDKRSKGRQNKADIIKLKPSDIVKKLHEQKGRCYLSGVKFSFERNNPNYWSLERLDNTKHHTIENTVLICRIMNGATQLTKDIIQKIYDEYKFGF